MASAFVSGDGLTRVAERRQRIEGLITENELLEERLAVWQSSGESSASEIRDGQRSYHDWYARAQRYVQAAELDSFRDMYEGGQFIRRIRSFLTAPFESSPLYDPDKVNSFAPRWAQPFNDTCRPALIKQRQLLAQALHETVGADAVLEELAIFFRRLPEFIDSIRAANNPNVQAPTVTRERDLQVLTNGMLRLLYRNIIAEDSVPKKSGASSRADFVIKDEGGLFTPPAKSAGQ
jgi:hypothetical protein